MSDKFAALRKFAAAIRDADGLIAVVQATRDHFPQGDSFDDLALASVTDPGGFEVAIAELMVVDAGRARNMRKELKARGKVLDKEERASHLRLVEPGDIDDDGFIPPDLPDFRTPEGYAVDGGGVYRRVAKPDGSPGLTRITYAPILVTARYTDVDTSEEQSRVAWKRGPEWSSRIVPRSTLASTRGIVELSSVGAPVNDATARATVAYLAAQEAANLATMPAGETVSHMGWVGDDASAFVLGDETIGGGDRDIQLNGGDSVERLAEGYRQSGTMTGWVDTLKVIDKYPLSYVAVYAALAPALLKITGCPSFIIDWSCNTTRGKTTTLRVAASCYGPVGDTDGLIHSWLSTATWIERTAAQQCDLPLLLDDTNKIPEYARKGLAQTIYSISSGEGKGRGSIKGTQTTSRWRTVVLSTGETSITDYTQDGGTRARVVCLHGYPLGKHGAERAEALERGLADHHGHAGPALIRYLDENRDLWPAIKALYQERLADYSRNPPNVIARRVAKYIALLDVVSDIMHSPDGLGVPAPSVDPVAHAWDVVCQTTDQADRQAEALRAVYEAAASRPTAFYGRHSIDSTGDAMQPHSGWLGEWGRSGDEDVSGDPIRKPWPHIAWIRSALERTLREAGHEPGSILSEWKARGWIDCGGKGYTRKISIDRSRVRCVVIPRSAFVDAGVI